MSAFHILTSLQRPTDDEREILLVPGVALALDGIQALPEELFRIMRILLVHDDL